jgi:hypothetical protein
MGNSQVIALAIGTAPQKAGNFVDVHAVLLHLEPAVALLVFIFVITRPFLVFGVFVGLFMGVRRYDFFWGGHFGELGFGLAARG